MRRAYNIHSSSGVVMYYKSRARGFTSRYGRLPAVVAEWHNIIIIICRPTIRSALVAAKTNSRFSRHRRYRDASKTKLYYTRILCPETHASHYRAAVVFTGKSNYTFTVKNARLTVTANHRRQLLRYDDQIYSRRNRQSLK